MITIPVNDLKKFFSAAAHVKSNAILPALECVKIDVLTSKQTTLTRHNTNAFIVQTIENAPEQKAKAGYSVLVDTKVLKQFVSSTTSSDVTISTKGKKVMLESGKLKTSCEITDLALYPKIPDYDSAKKIDLEADFFEAIYHSSFYIRAGKATMKDLPFYHHCYSMALGKNETLIAATTSPAVYMKKINQEVPEMSISEETCLAIQSFREGVLMQVEKFNVFETGNTIYGFLRSEQKSTPKILEFFKGNNSPVSFKLNLPEIISFCKYASSLDELPFAYVKFESVEDGILASYDGSAFGKEADMVLDAQKFREIDPFYVEATQVIAAFSTFSYGTLNFHPFVDGQRFYITTDDDPDYVGVLSLIDKKQATSARPKKEEQPASA